MCGSQRVYAASYMCRIRWSASIRGASAARAGRNSTTTSTVYTAGIVARSGDRAIGLAFFTMAASGGDAAALSRPARPQITYEELDTIRMKAERSMTTGMTYNVWYNKMSGGDDDRGGSANKVHSETRCDLARDSGYTRADLRTRQLAGSGAVNDAAYCCLFFARGSCPNG